MTNKRLVFTMTTGRSGTGYLARGMTALLGHRCHHEPEPSFADVMRPAQNDPDVARRFWVEQKLPSISRAAGSVYVETSHLFGKGFLEPLLALGIVPELILLTRAARSVATSLVRLETVPARTESGRRYLLQPDDPGVMSLPGWEDLSDYQLCFWYCLEMERRGQEAARLLRELDGRVVALEFDRMFEPDGIPALLRALELPEPAFLGRARFALIRRLRVNRKQGGPPNVQALEDQEQQEQEVRDRTGHR